MKTPLLLSAGLLAFALPAFAAPSSDASKAEQRVGVIFEKPENFTDVKDSQMGSEKARDGYLEILKEHIEKTAAKRLAEGQNLVVTITDVDMAGDFEPWRMRSGADDVRIVRDIYPPRINLTFKLMDANAVVIKEGTRQLRDLAFQMTLSPIDRNEPLRYEKQLLTDWLRDELSVPKAKK